MKSPAQRAYEVAPAYMGNLPWGELDEYAQQAWERIADAAINEPPPKPIYVVTDEEPFREELPNWGPFETLVEAREHTGFELLDRLFEFENFFLYRGRGGE